MPAFRPSSPTRDSTRCRWIVDEGFTLHQQVVRACVDEVLQVALRLDDHEMHIQRFPGRATDGLDHNRSERNIGNEPSIHDVDVDPIRAGCIDGSHLLCQAAEIGGENGRRNRKSTHAILSLRGSRRMYRSIARAKPSSAFEAVT